MNSTLHAQLDAAFSDELEELTEAVLLGYRPILSHLLYATLRNDLVRTLATIPNVQPWMRGGPPTAYRALGPLSVAQVALLGGTRAPRTVHSIAASINPLLDGGDSDILLHARRVFERSCEALESLAERHPVTAVKGPAARRAKITGLLHLGVAAALSSLMGTLHAHHQWTSRQDPDDMPDVVKHYFLAAVQAYGRVRISGRDLEVFREQYIEAASVEELADEHDVEIDVIVEHRRVFLTHVSAGLRAQLAPPAAPEPAALPPAAGDAPPALSPKGGRASRQRTR